MDEGTQPRSGRRARRAEGSASTLGALVVASLAHALLFALLPRPAVQELEVRGSSSEEPSVDIERDPVDLPVLGEGDGIGAIGVATHESHTRQTTIIDRGGEPIIGGSLEEGSGIVVAGGEGLSSRPSGSIHDGFGALATNDRPTPDVTKSEPDLSEKHTRVLRDALYERDKGLGLGADGPVIQALESSAQTSTAPVNGRAVFDVVVGSDGMVASLTVSEGGLAWSGVAKDALDAVRGKKSRVPAAAKNGVAIKIQIESKVLLASGHSPSTSIDIGGIPIKKGDDKSVKVSILNPIPQVMMVPVDRSGKINIPMANFQIFGTNVDPTDLDPKPRRVIASKVLDEHML